MAIKREYWPTQDWQRAEPGDTGMDAEKLRELNPLLETHFSNLNGIVVVHKGFVVFERYFNDFEPEDAQNIASVTKSVLSALIGIAIKNGLIQGVEQKVLDFFPEYKTAPNDFLKRSITIRHLLTMTAPFAWKTIALRYEPLDRLRRQTDWVKFILDLLGKNGTPGKFQYSTVGTHLLSAILSRAAGMSAREYANEHLFRPLGMREIPDRDMGFFKVDDVFGKNVSGWIKDPQGNSTGGWGLTLTPRDMARFGFLYVKEGLWDGEQVLSADWVRDSTRLQSQDYGYLWWVFDKKPVPTYAALGYGGNCIYCFPQKDLVVAITSSLAPKPRDRWLLLERCILPAVG